ncbi:hypothetical protein BDZ45DRAFT_748070 [Acephala macrosclerotiorum]|nr:hypothetical protein BDZ45DRAFT_748070 [Acephala macrosclerotiorum]
MRSSLLSAVVLIAVREVAGHALFQQLWSSCARVPASNSPVTDVGSTAFRCNGRLGVAGKYTVAAGQTVTVEMHQQPGDRSCANEAIGGAHYGPVMVSLSTVADATEADGFARWFKIFQDSWSPTSRLNKCCGRMNVVIPSDIAAGDYLLSAEVNALHTASSSGGAQFYMTCYQLSITGGGSASPSLVMFPGAYKASDPGIKVNIHAALATYVATGPTVYAGGTTKSAGNVCKGVEAVKTTGPAVSPAATHS